MARRTLRTGCVLAFLLLVGCGSDDEAIWQPSPSDRCYIQYAGSLDVPDGVDVVNLDMEETPESVIDGLHDDGIKVVCYISAGSWEPYRSDADQFPSSILGEAYEGFEDERWLDIRSPELRPLLTARIERAEDKGCDAVDPDNVNGWDNDTGFDISGDDQLEFDHWLFAEVHDHGMAVGLKNDGIHAPEVVDEVEFQVNEECIQYGSCDDLAPFFHAGKPIWSIEYEGSPEEVCPLAAEHHLATWIKDLSLSAGGHECPVP